MNCKIIEKMFDQYMNGELDPKTIEEVERHISACSDCAAKYAGFIKIKEGLSSVKDEPFPAGLHTAWTSKVQDYAQPRTARHSKLYKFMPALAAGVAAVLIVSAAVLTGVLNPAPSMSLARQEVSVAQDSSAAGGAAPQPEAAQNENAAVAEEGSLFMAQLAPEDAASQAPESDAAAPKEASDSAAAEPLQIFVTQETFDSMIIALDEKQIAYIIDGENIIVSVNEENQEAMASVFKENELELCAVVGGLFKFSISE